MADKEWLRVVVAPGAMQSYRDAAVRDGCVNYDGSPNISEWTRKTLDAHVTWAGLLGKAREQKVGTAVNAVEPKETVIVDLTPAPRQPWEPKPAELPANVTPLKPSRARSRAHRPKA